MPIYVQRGTGLRLERVTYPFHDSRTITGAAPERTLSFFRGQAAGQTEIDTNFTGGGSFDRPQEYWLYAMRVVPVNAPQFNQDVTPATAQQVILDTFAIVRNYLLFLKIGPKEYWNSPGWLNVAGVGVASEFALFDNRAAAPGQVTAYANARNGHNDTRAIYTLSIPIHIPTLQAIIFRMNAPGAGFTLAANRLVYVVWDGEHGREIS
jgi:hypothetical protein